MTLHLLMMNKLEIILEKQPELVTERMQLVALSSEHVGPMFRMRSDAEVMRYIPRTLAKTNADVEALIQMIHERFQQKMAINWAMIQTSDKQMIGYIGLVNIDAENDHAEIGYILLPEFQGKGFMHEAMQAVIDFSFEKLGVHRLSGTVDPENTASSKVLEKCGFKLEGHLREHEIFEGRYLDSLIYGLLNREYRSK
ncbi:MAG: GNAT family N-acetyltransferase [Chitinophagaceae bacterium]|jgi:ribosomal-protein-alanine N-acetyltransferase|nr:GNAT family N-acetyltransferase [Bacteroidota bacterium]MBP9932939.1 GNAT family N-acetyltransferase [Chitinophagaceae bacterium]